MVFVKWHSSYDAETVFIEMLKIDKLSVFWFRWLYIKLTSSYSHMCIAKLERQLSGRWKSLTSLKERAKRERERLEWIQRVFPRAGKPTGNKTVWQSVFYPGEDMTESITHWENIFHEQIPNDLIAIPMHFGPYAKLFFFFVFIFRARLQSFDISYWTVFQFVYINFSKSIARAESSIKF